MKIILFCITMLGLLILSACAPIQRECSHSRLLPRTCPGTQVHCSQDLEPTCKEYHCQPVFYNNGASSFDTYRMRNCCPHRW